MIPLDDDARRGWYREDGSAPSSTTKMHEYLSRVLHDNSPFSDGWDYHEWPYVLSRCTAILLGYPYWHRANLDDLDTLSARLLEQSKSQPPD